MRGRGQKKKSLQSGWEKMKEKEWKVRHDGKEKSRKKNENREEKDKIFKSWRQMITEWKSEKKAK